MYYIVSIPDLTFHVKKEYVAFHPLQISCLLSFLISCRLESGFGSGMVIASFAKLIL